MRDRTLVGLTVLLVPAIAAAHIRITSPKPRSSADLKERPCGMSGSTRANVQTYRPGATLHLVWDEYIPHPGWFRISFQSNGDRFEIPPASTGKDGSGAASNYPTEDLTGKTDPATGSLILADRIAHPALSRDVQLPDIECSNCTLQLIQMMTDKPPYSTDTASNDIYFTCVDLVLSATAPASDAGSGDPGTDSEADSASGNCSAGGASTLGGLLTLAGLAVGRRPRRRSVRTR